MHILILDIVTDNRMVVEIPHFVTHYSERLATMQHISAWLEGRAGARATSICAQESNFEYSVNISTGYGFLAGHALDKYWSEM